MHELIIPAKIDHLYEAQAFVSGLMEEAGFSTRMTGSISLVVEEIFVNIAGHAYTPDEGEVKISCAIGSDKTIELTFEDSGKPYDPLAGEKPDIGLPAGQREIGGLGIFLYWTIMDNADYRYENGRNILTLRKKEE